MLNSIAEVMNSIEKATNFAANVTDSIANRMKSIAKVTSSVAKTCNICNSTGGYLSNLLIKSVIHGVVTSSINLYSANNMFSTV